MNCERVRPYLPGFAADELRPDTIRWVESHLAGCAACRGAVARHRGVATALAGLSQREVEPPAHLVDAVMDKVRSRHRKLVPVPPVPPAELIRLLQENRDALAAAAGAFVAAAGVAWALWRTIRRPRPRTEPA